MTNVTPNTTDLKAPDGSQTATKIVTPGTITCGSTPSVGVLSSIRGGLTPGQTYTVSVWLRGANGGESVFFGLNDTYTTGVTLTQVWQRYTVTYSDIGSNDRGFELATWATNITYYFWGAQTELSSSVGPYILTDASPRAGYGGTTTLTTSSLGAGVGSIAAAYPGDAYDAASGFTGFAQTVNKAPAAVTLSNMSQTYTGSPLTPTAATVPPGLGIVWSGAPDTNAGNYSVTATVNDQNYTGSASGTFTVTTYGSSVSQPTSSLNPSNYGNSVTFTATVTPSAATGTVTFFDGSNSIGSSSLNNGVATLTTSALPAGSNSIIASYAGDTNYGGSTSPTLTQIVNSGPSTTVVTSSLNPSTFGNAVTITATVTPSTATGTVTFFDANGTLTLGSGTLRNGQTTLTLSTLAPGPHSITATYNGDAYDVPGTSAVLAQTVNRRTTTMPSYCSPLTQ